MKTTIPKSPQKSEAVERPQRLILNLTVEEFDEINKAGMQCDMTTTEYAYDRILAAAWQKNIKTTRVSPKERDRIAKAFIPPAHMDKAKELAKKGGWELNTIAQVALAIGLDHLQAQGNKALNLPPQNLLMFPH